MHLEKNRLYWIIFALSLIVVGVLIARETEAFYAELEKLNKIEYQQPKKQVVEVVEVNHPLPIDYIEKRLWELAEEYNVNGYKLVATMKCESGLVEDIQSRIYLWYGREQSFGVYQIHLPDHPTVTKECAIDFECASRYALPLFQNRPSAWICYRNLF